jgi:type II secretory pathway pseudopilin PulG
VNRSGLTLIEAIIAMAIMAAILTAFTALVVGNIRENAKSGAKVQAVQVLNYLGRKVTGGDSNVLPNSGSLEWNYGQLSNNFGDLQRERQWADLNLFKASVDNLGDFNRVSGVVLINYRINVCWQSPEGEQCVRATTVGRDPVVVGTPPPVLSN